MSLGEYLGAGSAITKGLWHLADVNDASGNGNTLTNNGSIAFNSAIFGPSADLGTANTTKWLSRTDALGFVAGSSRTCLLWTRLQTELSGVDKNYGLMFMYHTTTNVLFRMIYQRVSSVNRLFWDRTRNGTGVSSVTYNVNLGTTNKHLVGYTFDGTNLLGFLNGRQVASLTPTLGNGASAVSNAFSLGGAPGGGDYASTYLDEAIVENVVWSPEKIRKYYTWALGRGALALN